MNKSSKVRISLDCSPEERKLIRLLATMQDMTISDFLLSLAKSKSEQISQFASLHSKSSQYQTEQKNKGRSEADDFWKALEGIA